MASLLRAIESFPMCQNEIASQKEVSLSLSFKTSRATCLFIMFVYTFKKGKHGLTMKLDDATPDSLFCIDHLVSSQPDLGTQTVGFP